MHWSLIISGKSAVIFDLFFTLVTTDIADDELPPTHAALGVAKSAWREQISSHYHERVTGAETDPYRILESLAHAIDPAIPDSVIRVAAEQRVARFERILTDVPEATLSVLAALREQGIKTALISNSDVIETQAWDRSPLAPLFDTAILSWQVGLAKPDAEIYHRCMERLDLLASQCVFVGDGGSRELPGAQAVGLTTVFTTGFLPELSEREIGDRESSADHIIGPLEELLHSP